MVAECAKKITIRAIEECATISNRHMVYLLGPEGYLYVFWNHTDFSSTRDTIQSIEALLWYTTAIQIQYFGGLLWSTAILFTVKNVFSKKIILAVKIKIMLIEMSIIKIIIVILVTVVIIITNELLQLWNTLQVL